MKLCENESPTTSTSSRQKTQSLEEAEGDSLSPTASLAKLSSVTVPPTSCPRPLRWSATRGFPSATMWACRIRALVSRNFLNLGVDEGEGEAGGRVGGGGLFAAKRQQHTEKGGMFIARIRGRLR